MADDKLVPQAGNGRWLRLALAASLALNLAVAGVIGGAILKGAREHRSAMVRDLGFGPFTEALGPEDRAALRSAFLERAPDFRARRRDMREDFAAVLAALRAEPFDAAALGAAMGRQMGRAAEQMALGQALMTEHIAAMSPEARKRFADRLEASLTRRPPRRP
ncbi:MAG TPA: periplasmic heavy metal sensor [Paracoccaceae bacterium]